MIRLDSTEAELDALQQLAERLGGFAPQVSLEWLDGALTALMAGPSVPADPVDALAPLLGDAWPRTFADPEDDAAARTVFAARWRVLRSQLDPDALYDDPGALRLAPLLLSPAPLEPAAERASEDALPEDGYPLGLDWADGVRAVIEAPDSGWAAAGADDAFELALAAIHALGAEPAAGEPIDEAARETLVDEAAFAMQDLRLWWLEHAPRTAPRRVEKAPGRNDPCPCRSGKKFKKCHGAADASAGPG